MIVRCGTFVRPALHVTDRARAARDCYCSRQCVVKLQVICRLAFEFQCKSIQNVNNYLTTQTWINFNPRLSSCWCSSVDGKFSIYLSFLLLTRRHSSIYGNINGEITLHTSWEKNNLASLVLQIVHFFVVFYLNTFFS